MTGGKIEILRDAGDHLGGPFGGETVGMRGGAIVVRGSAGARAADRMRRGTVVVEGACGPYAGSRMIAGTLVVLRRAGPLPGYLMKRGTIVLGADCDALSPTFIDCGVHALVALRLMADFVGAHSRRAATCLRGPLRRYAGDMAVLGKGEILVGTRGGFATDLGQAIRSRTTGAPPQRAADDRDHRDGVRAGATEPVRGAAPAVCLRRLAAPVRHERPAFSCPMAQRASEVEHRALALRRAAPGGE